jgi:hypothetical protein
MSKLIHRARWSDAEKLAVMAAYNATDTAEEFFRHFRASVPTAPVRTTKAYITYLCETIREDRRPVYEDLSRMLQQELRKEKERLAALKEAQAPKVEAPKVEAPKASIPDYLDEIKDGPMDVPVKTPSPNFVGDARPKPTPHAAVPRHYRVPVYTQMDFTYADIVAFFAVPEVMVKAALDGGVIPSHEGSVRREVFMALHESMSDGLDFDAACDVIREKFREKPIVPAVEEAPVEPDPNKVREGYIPNPFLKGPFPIEKKQEAPTLDDPNPDAKEAFTVEEAAKALGLSSTDTVLTAIRRDRFPAVKVDGKWYLTRADLKRVLALRDSSFSIEEAFKRAGAPPVAIPTLNDTSWTDNLAPLTPEEEGLAAALPDVVDRDPVWEAVSLEALASELHIHVASVYQGVSDHLLVQKHGDDLGVPRQAFDLIEEKWRKCRNLKEAFDYAAEKLGVLPPPAPATETGDERVWTLEALRDGVFTAEQARDILGLKDAARTNWALGLLAAGKVTLDQAAKLLR